MHHRPFHGAVPGSFNADFEPQKAEELIPVAIAREKNYLDIGESIDPLDWEPGTSADSIVARVIARKKAMTNLNLSGNIILLHDAGGDSRQATVDALPRIIHYFKERGYQFTTIADLLGKKKEDLMPSVPRGSGYYLLQLNYFLACFRLSRQPYPDFCIYCIYHSFSFADPVYGIVASKQHRWEKEFDLKPFWNTGRYPCSP